MSDSLSELIGEITTQTRGMAGGSATAVGGGTISILGLGINEWMAIIGGICALIGAIVTIINYRSAQKVREEYLERLRAGQLGDKSRIPISTRSNL